MEFSHVPVLFRETIESLAIRPDGRYIDGTAGGGGHSAAILERLNEKGVLLSIDRDPDAIAACKARFAGVSQSRVVQGNFSDLYEIAEREGVLPVDGVLLDIGVSSHQLDDPARGFSYQHDAPLDMRMSQSGTSAKDLVNTLSADELADILRRFGEERSAWRIAKGIVAARGKKPIETTGELAEIVKESVPAAVRRAPGHPARQTFQALRIAVNAELGELDRFLEVFPALLAPGGRCVIISFHSLEDRRVKQVFRDLSWTSRLPDHLARAAGERTEPVCVPITRKPVFAGDDEVARNPRARSARLRACEKVAA